MTVQRRAGEQLRTSPFAKGESILTTSRPGALQRLGQSILRGWDRLANLPATLRDPEEGFKRARNTPTPPEVRRDEISEYFGTRRPVFRAREMVEAAQQ